MTLSSQFHAPGKNTLRLVDFINKNLADYSSSKDIDPVLQRSIPSFTKYMGMSMTKYVRRRRVERALQIIMRDPTIALAQVASQVGVDNATKLHTLLLGVVGISASDYHTALFCSERPSADTAHDNL